MSQADLHRTEPRRRRRCDIDPIRAEIEAEVVAVRHVEDAGHGAEVPSPADALGARGITVVTERLLVGRRAPR